MTGHPMASYVETEMRLLNQRMPNDNESPTVLFIAKYLLELYARSPWHMAAELELFVHSRPVETMAAIALLPREAPSADVS